MLRSGALQAKLSIGQPGDVYEQEADRVADAVMRMPEPGVQRQVEPEEEEEELQAKVTSGHLSEVTPNLESRVNAIRGGGQPLPKSTRAFFEPRFGYDFSQVRVHNDAEADKLNSSLNARASTTGQNIFFRPGEYNPGSSSGRELLAHELTHVVQQTGNGLQSTLTVGQPEDKYDQKANRVADAVLIRQTEAEKSHKTANGMNGKAKAVPLQLLGDTSVIQREEPPTTVPKVGLTEEEFNDDWKLAGNHEDVYFRHFENTTSAAEFAYGEANRRLTKYSKLKDPKDLWADLGKDLFFAALDLIPAIGRLGKAIKRIGEKSDFYAEGLKKLITFTATTLAKYGPQVVISQDADVPAVKDPPSLFGAMRKVHATEVSRVKEVKNAWVKGHRKAVNKGIPWPHRLQPQFEKHLQPMDALSKDTKLTKKYEEMLWKDYLSKKVKVHYSTYIFQEFAYTFSGMSIATAKYLNTRFGWALFTIAGKCAEQRDLAGWARIWEDWIDIRRNDL